MALRENTGEMVLKICPQTVRREAEREGIERAAARVGVTAEVARQHYVMRGEVVKIKEGG